MVWDLRSGGIGWVTLSFVAAIVFSVSSGDVLFRDDFEGDKNFSTGEDAYVSLRYAHGGYEVLVKDPAVTQEPRIFFDEPEQRALSFAAEATILRGPTAIGLGCYPNASTGYVLAVTPSGEYAVLLFLGDQKPNVLTQGQADPLRAPGEANQMSITCQGGGSEPTILKLSVNGEEAVRYDDPDGYDSFDAVGFFVATDQAGTLVRFDNALAKRA